MLARVVDTLALVRLGRTLGADLGRDLTDLLLGDALDGDVRIVGHLEADVLRGLVDHGVGVAQGEIEVLALERGTVADARELELLLKTGGHADDHVVEQRAGEALLGVGLLSVVVAGDGELQGVGVAGELGLGGDLLDADQAGELAVELALGPLDVDVVAIDCHGDSGGNQDRLLTNTRHGFLLSILATTKCRR